MSDNTTVSREYHIYCQASSHLYIVKKERQAILCTYGCWSQKDWLGDFFWEISLFWCRVLFLGFGVFVFGVFGGISVTFVDFQEGGGNFLIDGYQILKDLEADPETRWLGPGKARGFPGNPGLFSTGNLGCGFKYFSFLTRKLGKWANLTIIFFSWVAVQPPTSNTYSQQWIPRTACLLLGSPSCDLMSVIPDSGKTLGSRDSRCNSTDSGLTYPWSEWVVSLPKEVHDHLDSYLLGPAFILNL